MKVESKREIFEARESEMERHCDAVEGLLLLQDTHNSCVTLEHRLQPLKSSADSSN